MLTKPKTLTEETVEWLKRGIAEGRWGRRLPGVLPLARQCGISPDTMRGAVGRLENEGLITNAGAGRRREVAVVEPSPAGPRKMRVAMLLRDRMEHMDAGFRNCIAMIREELEAKGHVCLVLPKTQADLKYHDARIIQSAAGVEADLWVVEAGSRGVMNWFARRPEAVFAIGGAVMPGVAMVGSAPDVALIRLIHRLCDLGHRRMVFFLPGYHRPAAESPTGMIARMEREMKSRGIEVGPYNTPAWDETAAGLHAQLEALFKFTPPTAIYATGTLWMAGIQSFLARRGLRVPEDVSLICGTEDAAFEWTDPPLAFFRHDDARVFRRVVQWVGNRAAGRQDRGNSTIGVELIAGASIGPAKDDPAFDPRSRSGPAAGTGNRRKPRAGTGKAGLT
jgi:DNA-binding LacI/PurR family transcriptional regulator